MSPERKSEQSNSYPAETHLDKIYDAEVIDDTASSETLPTKVKHKLEDIRDRVKATIEEKMPFESKAPENVAGGEYDSLKLSVGLRETKAEYHDQSEDASYVNKAEKVFAVFDGAGGAGGNPAAAARAAAEAVGRALSETDNVVNNPAAMKQDLIDAFDRGRHAVEQKGEGGTTVATATKIYNIEGQPVLGVAHAGDTRLFVYSASEQVSRSITPDQSDGNVINNALNAQPDKEPNYYTAINLKKGDRVMLCSDGITGDREHQFLTDAEMREAFTQPTTDQAAQRFLELSKKTDDKTVLVIDIDLELSEAGNAVSGASEETASSGVTTNTSAENRNNHGIRLQRAAEKLGLPSDATAEQVREAKKARRAAGKPARTGVNGDDDTAQPKADGSLLTPEQLERNIQKYESRVIKYEELAAVALASRMNGRLFKREEHHKEFDEKFEENTHFLDGFTMALDNSLMKKWLSEGKDDAEAAELLREHQQARELRRNELNRTAMIDGDSKQFEGQNSLKARWSRLKKNSRKGMEWYAGQKTSTKVILGVLGVGVVAGVGATAGAALGAAGAVGLGAAKAGKAYAQQRSKMYAPQKEVTDYDLFTNERSVREQVIAAKDHSSEQREKSIHDADRNKKIAVGLAGVSAILLGAGMAGKIAEHSDDIKDSWNGFWDRLPNLPEPEVVSPEPSVQPTPEVAPSPEPTSEPAPEVEPTPEPTPESGETDGGRDPAPAPEQAPTDTIESGIGGGEWQSGNVENYFNGSVGSTEFTTAGVENFNQWIDGYSVQSGDSIWSLSENYLRAQGVSNPSVYQIDAVKDSMVANLQAQGLADANGWLYAGVRM